ncbi:MAG: ATP-binding cassette domain-containing protein [Rhodobacteraceae bacterium]|nr:ATP-binding cassette domain-containing protein [Paracoccaceae bacterium]
MTDESSGPLGEKLIDAIAKFRPVVPGRDSLKRVRLTGPDGVGLTRPWQVLAVAALGGLAGTYIVALLSTPIEDMTETGEIVWTGVLFILALLAFRHLQIIAMRSTSSSVEAALSRMRIRLAEHVSRLDLKGFEGLSRAQLQGGLAHHYAAISDATLSILIGVQSAVLLVLTLGYLAMISVLALGMSAVVFIVAVKAYLSRQAELSTRMREMAASETGLAASIGELLDGFKELRLDAGKRAAVMADIESQSDRSATERAKTANIFAGLMVFSNSMAYMLAGSVVFLLPLFSETPPEELARLVAVVLFLIGPLGSVVSASKQLAAARFSINALARFEAEVEELLRVQREAGTLPVPHFRSLEARGICYTHRPRSADEAAYQIGPVDLTLKAGEVVFITGGNGSGKTTLMRVLCGLYPPTSGELVLNGQRLEIDGPDGEAYRQLFATIFAEAHVFRKPYALPADKLPILREQLEDLGIGHKLPEDLASGLAPDKLSTGQRKRLALALALTEDRPVLFLDEWAADQDPASREKFYRERLPAMKATGKAVLAISHDDRFFDVADRRYHMEEGRLTLVEAQ